MTVRNELLEKKEQLEFSIKLAMQKFMDETGLMIVDIFASNSSLGGIVGSPSKEELEKMKKENLMNSLKISVKLWDCGCVHQKSCVDNIY